MSDTDLPTLPTGNAQALGVPNSMDYPRLVYSAPYFTTVAIAEIIEPSIAEALEDLLPTMIPPYVDQAALEAVQENAVLLVGSTMTGPLYLSPTIPTQPSQAASMAYVDSMIATAGIPEVPPVPAGAVWGREVGQWTPLSVEGGFLPLSGGTMSGDLILDGPPSPASDPNQAATKGYVDGLITGSVEFIGTINAASSAVTYTAASGISGTTLVPPSTVPDCYVICAVSGTNPYPPLQGIPMHVGDWVISDGVSWNVISVEGQDVLAEDVTVTPTVLGTDDVQDALTAIVANFINYAPLVSPALQGIPTAPSPPISDNSNAIATTAWIQAQAFLTGITLTGDVNGVQDVNLDALVMVGDIQGFVSTAGTGDIDDLILAQDSSGEDVTTPNFMSSVVLAAPDATSVTVPPAQ